LRLSKGDICAIKLPDRAGYIYFLYLGGNLNQGYLVKVYDFKSKTLEKDVELIQSKQSLFENEYIITYLAYYDALLTKVGRIKIDKSCLSKIKFHVRVSLKANNFNLNKLLNLSKDWNDKEYNQALVTYALSGNVHHFKDWRIDTYGFIGNKFDFLKEDTIGILSPKEKKYMLQGCTYLAEDIIEFYMNGIDRLRAEEMIFQ